MISTNRERAKAAWSRFFEPGRFGIGKVWGGIFAILVPGYLVITANHKIFPDTYDLAVGMVVMSMGIACLFAVASAFALAKTRKSVLWAHFFLLVVLSANLGAHWYFARALSAARQSAQERRTDEDRAEDRRKSQVDDAVRLADAQTKLTEARRKELNAEANRDYQARKLGRRAGQSSEVGGSAAITVPAIEAQGVASVTAPKALKPRLSVEEVMEQARAVLMWIAVGELLASIVAYGWCSLKWEWDVDGDGIADSEQGGSQSRWPWATSPGK